MLNNKIFLPFLFFVTILHTVTYFIFGAIFSNLFDYASLFSEPVTNNFMQPITSENILYGPFMQPLRGLLFALAIYPLRNLLIERKHGWFILWGLFIVIGIISTPGPAPCSIEGVIYTQLPMSLHLKGVWEILFQTLAFSYFLTLWLKRKASPSGFKSKTNSKRVFQKLLMALVIACFGYVGYAIGGILTASLAGKSVNLKAASNNFSKQFPILFAFFVNLITLYFFILKAWLRKMNYFKIFLLFWIVDSLSPVFFQLLFSYPMPLYLAFFMGLFPALVITVSVRMNESKIAEL